jgi:hypothetical protein
MTNAIKKICRERQAIRLHIEVMKSTQDELKRRAKYHRKDLMSFNTAKEAAKRLQTKIAKAEQELMFLERNFKW